MLHGKSPIWNATGVVWLPSSPTRLFLRMDCMLTLWTFSPQSPKSFARRVELFIADEVQSGFGRTGTHLWGHARHSVQPDIVTMGKPMGNGYPVAGVVLRPELVTDFGASMRYFNTFGGNSVAIAAAKAVLDTIIDEHLMQKASKVGAQILEGLKNLQEKYDFVGDVRGTGLYFGVELVKDRNLKIPDMDRALAIVNGLRDRRILISATGADAHILKIRPPLVYTSEHAGRLLEGIDQALAAV